MKTSEIQSAPATTETLRRSAFTLIELLTVIAIIGILAAILIIGMGKVRQSANSAMSMSQLRQSSIAVMTHVNNSGYYPRMWNNGSAATGAWYGIPEIREALGDTSPDRSNNLAVSQSLMSPLVETERALTGDDPIVNHYAILPGPGNKHPNFNPPLSSFAVGNPGELILLGDTGPGDANSLGDVGDGQSHMYQLNVLASSDPSDPEPIDRDYDGWHGWAKFDFDRHGNNKTQVTFCDGHVELRGIDEFYNRNFVPTP